MRLLNILYVSLLVLGTSRAATASVSLFDDFSYPVGQLDGRNGGIGWTGGWVAPSIYNVAPGSLSYGNLQTSGNRAQFDPTNLAGTNALRTISTFGSPGSTFWLSFMMSFDGTIGQSTADVRLDDSLGTGFIYIGRPRGDENNWGVLDTVSSGVPSLSSVPITPGTAVFVAVRIDLNPNPNLFDTVTVYFNPDTAVTQGASPGVPGIVFTDQNYAASNIQMALDGSAFPDPTVTPVDANYGPFRGGTTYFDVAPAVVPEPASLSIMAAVLTCLGVRTRRRVKP